MRHEIEKLIRDVPNYPYFLTVDELNESTRMLASRHADVVELISLGKSREGEEIQAMRIGRGKRKALLYAMPHPNEPIGSMTIEYLSRRLAEDAELREALDVTWYMVKCVDPVGARLNEGWFKGPFTIRDYARHYFRPTGLEVEWTFPLDYKTLHFNQPLPETRALMKLIEMAKPDFAYSLHNSGFSGVYCYVSQTNPSFNPDFYRLVKSENLPLHLGEAENPYFEKLADAVFRVPSTQDMYDFILANTGEDPAAMIETGGGGIEYARSHNEKVEGFACELPYFIHPAIVDTSPSDMNRRDAMLLAAAATREIVAFMQSQYDLVCKGLILHNPLRESVESLLISTSQQLDADENWAKTNPDLLQPATIAEKFDKIHLTNFYNLLNEGMFLRMLELEIKAGNQGPQLLEAQGRALERFEAAAARLENELDYQVVPIQKLVKVQLGAGLLYLFHSLEA
jgi:hypothetical protein